MRSLAALVLAACMCAVLFGCAQACPPKAKAEIAADWFASVRLACKGYHSLAECPEAERLKRERFQSEVKAGCR